MDRFKFRIWNKLENKYSNIGLDTVLTSCKLTNISLNLSNYYIIQQCLGVTDKNNKLIYEGDVVKYLEHNEEPLEPSISEVMYSDLGASFFCKTIRPGKCKRYNSSEIEWFKHKHNVDVSEDIDYFSATDEYGTNWKHIEVIGSIANNYFIALDNIITQFTTTEELIKLTEDKTV